MKKIGSPDIQRAIEIAIAAGNSVKEFANWSKANVAHMTLPMSKSTHKTIAAELPSLRHFSNSDPHYEPHEGFFCDHAKEAISFPKTST